jgi:hypothetical protein
MSAMGRILELLGEPIPDLQDACGLARAEFLRRHWSAAMEKHFPGLDLEPMRRRLAAEEEWRRAMLDEIQTVYASGVVHESLALVSSHAGRLARRDEAGIPGVFQGVVTQPGVSQGRK